MKRGFTAEIDLNAVSHNLKVIKDISHNLPAIAVVKADAYGHGAVEISGRLVDDGVEYLAVAFTEEAKDLRHAGINAPILVLFDPDAEDIFKYGLVPVISDKKTAVVLSKEAERRNTALNVHLKIDTGMGRLGFAGDPVREILEIADMKGINVEGVMSHFSEADIKDESFARMQIASFNSVRKELLQKGLYVRFFHIANSAAVETFPESHFDAVRPGIMLYGYSPIQQSAASSQQSAVNKPNFEVLTPNSQLIPAMTVKAKILALRRLPAGTPISYGRTFVTKKESLIGVMAVGYADGLSRRLSNNAEVIVGGRRVPVVGRVCMDLTMIDLTGIEHVEEGDDAVIIGKQGNESIYADELARRAGTIPYEILTSIGYRAKKVYY